VEAGGNRDGIELVCEDRADSGRGLNDC